MAILAKVLLLGDGAVGKTALRDSFLGRSFSTNYIPTLGADFIAKTITLEGRELRFQIWDLAGQPAFRDVRKLYYRNTAGAFLVFDLTRLETLTSISTWLTELAINANTPKVSIVVIGNKLDLLEKEIDLENEIESILETIKLKHLANIDTHITYIETSAKTGKNVPDAFFKLGEGILELYVNENF